MKRAAGLCLAFLVLLVQWTAAQVEMSELSSGDPPTSFYAEALSFASRDSLGSRLDVFIQVGYDNLTFVKVGDTYDASYELTIMLQDSTNAIAAEQSWSEEIKGLAFDATIAAGSSRVSQRVLPAGAGKYVLSVQLRDNENKAVRRLQRQVVVPSFARPGVSLSSVMLVSRLVRQGGKTTITPSVSPNMGLVPEAFHAFVEAYERGPADSLAFTAAVLNAKQDTLVRADTSLRVVQGRNEVFFRIDQSKLPVGDYRLLVLAVKPGTSDPLAISSRSFIVRWRGMPLSTKNIDVAIDQLKYIARDAELDSLKSAKAVDEKQRLFQDFWKRRDPNPNTPRNERMEEYYGRVEYANRHFSHYREGWRTDMGMVYIIFGPPNNVERHPFDIDAKPYEVWAYYDINQVFAFVDETGFGDYRLSTPLWEVWRRPR